MLPMPAKAVREICTGVPCVGISHPPRKIIPKCPLSAEESPRQTKPKKGPKRKFMNFAHFCEFGCFSLGKQARFTLIFCSGMPREKFMNWPFFGLVCRGHVQAFWGFCWGFGIGSGFFRVFWGFGIAGTCFEIAGFFLFGGGGLSQEFREEGVSPFLLPEIPESLFWLALLPSDTKLLLTKNDSEIIMFEKLRISRVIPWKRLFSWTFREHQLPSKLWKIVLKEVFNFVSEGMLFKDAVNFSELSGKSWKGLLGSPNHVAGGRCRGALIKIQKSACYVKIFGTLYESNFACLTKVLS